MRLEKLPFNVVLLVGRVAFEWTFGRIVVDVILMRDFVLGIK